LNLPTQSAPHFNSIPPGLQRTPNLCLAPLHYANLQPHTASPFYAWFSHVCFVLQFEHLCYRPFCAGPFFNVGTRCLARSSPCLLTPPLHELSSLCINHPAVEPPPPFPFLSLFTRLDCFFPLHCPPLDFQPRPHPFGFFCSLTLNLLPVSRRV